jgi:hypothetical protein
VQLSEQHHRSGPRRTEASHSPHARLSDKKDSRRYDEGVRGDADDPPRTFLTCKPHVKDEVRFVNKLFDIFHIAA